MNKEQDDLSRVDRQPLTGSAELPQRPTEDVPSTVPEDVEMAAFEDDVIGAFCADDFTESIE